MNLGTNAKNSDVDVATTNHVERFNRICRQRLARRKAVSQGLHSPNTDAPGSKVVVSFPALMISLCRYAVSG